MYKVPSFTLTICLIVHSQNRVQNSVKNRFLDESPAVRESTVDLVGRYVLSHPDLIPSYYDKIVDRISVSHTFTDFCNV